MQSDVIQTALVIFHGYLLLFERLFVFTQDTVHDLFPYLTLSHEGRRNFVHQLVAFISSIDFKSIFENTCLSEKRTQLLIFPSPSGVWTGDMGNKCAGT